MKTIEMIITKSLMTKLSVQIPDGLNNKEEYEYISGIMNETTDQLIFDYPSQELLDTNVISEWDIKE